MRHERTQSPAISGQIVRTHVDRVCVRLHVRADTYTDPVGVLLLRYLHLQ